jgi:hypothetical protein
VFRPHTASTVALKYFSTCPLVESTFNRSPPDGIRSPPELHVGRPDGGALVNRRCLPPDDDTT